MTVGLLHRNRSSTGKGRSRSRLRNTLLFFALLFTLYYFSSHRAPSIPSPLLVSDERRNPARIHKVERTVLESLRLLEIELNDGKEADEEELRYRAGHSYDEAGKGKTPPTVGYIPEIPTRKDGQLVPASEIDRRVCGGPCSFLFPAWLGEQETKAQAHLYQLGLLALALNRTLVLPNVIRSRLGACYAKPFTFYYAAEALRRLGIPTILQSDLVAWAAVRDPPPTAQVISMLSTKLEHPEGAIAFDAEGDPTLVPTKPDRKLCLTPPKVWLDWSTYSPITLFPPEAWHKADTTRMAFGKRVVGTLLSPEIATKVARPPGFEQPPPHVLAFNYELRYPIISPASLRELLVEAQMPEGGFELEADLFDVEASVEAIMSPVVDFEHFPYAPAWISQAESVAASLSPFIAIHWRQETLPSSVLGTCAQRLLETLEQLALEHPDIRTVYLATDYPLHGSAHSGTFARLLTEDHHAAMRNFVAKLPKGLRLTSYTQEAEDAAEGLDSGLLGIIDKNVAMRAEVFVTGFSGSFQYDPTACVHSSSSLVLLLIRWHRCGKESSFTRQILLAREKKLEEGDTAIRNKVELWDVDGRRKPLTV